MKLYAVTYTDPSEPWGRAVLGGVLYRTPAEVVEAANAHFDEWRAYHRARMITDWHRNYARRGAGYSFDQYQADEWTYEYGIGVYTVA
jgi:hypothetical protein